MLTTEIKDYINKSILCWLATASEDGIPNVSPKEIFNYHGNDCLLIANIASPQSITNIKENANVCVSFIDVLVQKGWQLKGKATIVFPEQPDFNLLMETLLPLTEGKFPIRHIISIKIEKAKPIVAPRYILYPHTTEEEQIASAIKSYKL